MLNIKTWNKTTKGFDSTVNMVEPKNLIADKKDDFEKAVQLQAMKWVFCDAQGVCNNILKSYPHFATLKADSVSSLDTEELANFNNYCEQKAIVDAYESYDFSDDEKALLSKLDKLPTMVHFYASFISQNEGICMNGFEPIYKKCRSLFHDYILTDTPAAMNTDPIFKELKGSGRAKKVKGVETYGLICDWYNNLFGLEKDNEFLTAKGSTISKVSASFVQLLVSDFKVPAKLNKKTGKAELGSYRKMTTCKKIFRTYILAKVQNGNLDEARKAIQDEIAKEVKKAESEAKKDEKVKDAE